MWGHGDEGASFIVRPTDTPPGTTLRLNTEGTPFHQRKKQRFPCAGYVPDDP